MPLQSWSVEYRRGTAEELHLAEVDGTHRRIVVNHVTEPALVMGSVQPIASVDVAAVERAGLQLARRRSGGGAVLLIPGEHVWFDVVLPSTDSLHSDDVERATWWLGEAVRSALSELAGDGVPPVGAGGDGTGGGGARGDLADRLRLHRRGVSDRALGRIACFAAMGPGELSLGGDKLLGVSQRRNRHGARFQCVLHWRWQPATTAALLRTDDPDAMARALGRVATLADLGISSTVDVVQAVAVALEAPPA